MTIIWWITLDFTLNHFARIYVTFIRCLTSQTRDLWSTDAVWFHYSWAERRFLLKQPAHLLLMACLQRASPWPVIVNHQWRNLIFSPFVLLCVLHTEIIASLMSQVHSLLLISSLSVAASSYTRLLSSFSGHLCLRFLQ